MKKLKKAFTLTELMVALGVVGLLIAVLIPIIYNLIPDQNTIMAKRAYYSLQTVIADMLNDNGCYPDKSMLPDGRRRVGFNDESFYDECDGWSGEDDIPEGGHYDEFTKFKVLFNKRISDDGIKWTFNDSSNYYTSSIDNTDGTDGSGYRVVVIDLNGDNGPNCGRDALSTECSDASSRDSGWDRYSVKIYEDGNLEILDDWAVAAIDINRDIAESDYGFISSSPSSGGTGSGTGGSTGSGTGDPVTPGIVKPGVGDPVVKDPIDIGGKIDVIKDPGAGLVKP